MIENKLDYLLYLEADKFALGIDDRLIKKIGRVFFPHYIWRFQKLMRKAEYYKNCKKGIFNKIIFIMTYFLYKKLSLRLGFSIPLNVFGAGLSIAHYGTIVVNSAVKVGDNCRIHIDVNIGTSNGSKLAPQIGNNCYIAPGTKLYGDIKIADNIAMGANSVVNKSFDESHIVIAGVPAKKIGQYSVERVVLFAKEAVISGVKRDKQLSCLEQNKIITDKDINQLR